MVARSGWTGPAEDRQRYFVPDVTRYRRGGVGVVFEAERRTMAATHAAPLKVGLKMLTGIDEDRFGKLLERSAVLRTIDHRHLASHLECFLGPAPTDESLDEDEYDQFFAAHQWVDGVSLKDKLADARPRDVLNWGRQVGEAIDYLHNFPGGGFAHRDVHARNIVITPDAEAVLIDYDTILWGDVQDTNVAGLSSLGVGDREPGLAGAQAEDIKALAGTLLRAFARDDEGRLDLGELREAVEANLEGFAKDPKGVTEELTNCLRKPTGSPIALVNATERRFERRAARVRVPARKSVIRLVVLVAAAALLSVVVLQEFSGRPLLFGTGTGQAEEQNDPSPAQAGSSEGPAGNEARVRCWDGSETSSLDECSQPKKLTGLRWVFPGAYITEDLCERNAYSDGIYWSCYSYDQLGIPAVPGVIDLDSPYAESVGPGITFTIDVEDGSCPPNNECRPWVVDGQRAGLMAIERGKSSIGQKYVCSEESSPNDTCNSWDSSKTPKGTMRVWISYADAPFGLNFYVTESSAIKKVMEALDPRPPAELKGEQSDAA